MKKLLTILGIIGIAVVLYFLARWYVEKKYEPPKQVQQAQQETNQLQEEAQKLLDSKDLDK